MLFATVSLVGYGLAFGTYLLAIERTEEYAEQLRTIFDLHRQKLKDGWASGPRTYSDDEQYFDAARVFIQSGLELLLDARDVSPKVARDTAQNSERTPPPREGHIKAKPPGPPRFTQRFFVRFIDITGGLLRRFRILHIAVALAVLWTALGSLGLSVASPRNSTDGVRLMTLPIEQPLPSRVLLEPGSIVDVIVRPCGILLENVLVATDEIVGIDQPPLATLELDEGALRRIDGCSPDAVTLVARG